MERKITVQESLSFSIEGREQAPYRKVRVKSYLFFEPIFDFGLCFIEAAFRIRGAC